MSREPGSSRHADKKMRVAGLGRLRWYCTPCEKQCRNANAFKQHTPSESHVRRLQGIGNVNETINDFSQRFQSAFLGLLRTSHQEKSIHSNRFYQTYIADKHHIHLSVMRWHSLTDFVIYLGREGLFRVEEKEDGLFNAWIDRSPAALHRAAELKKKQHSEAADQSREEDMIKSQIERAQGQVKAAAPTPVPETASAALDSSRSVAFHMPATRSIGTPSSERPRAPRPNAFKAAKLLAKRKTIRVG